MRQPHQGRRFCTKAFEWLLWRREASAAAQGAYTPLTPQASLLNAHPSSLSSLPDFQHVLSGGRSRAGSEQASRLSLHLCKRPFQIGLQVDELLLLGLLVPSSLLHLAELPADLCRPFLNLCIQLRKKVEDVGAVPAEVQRKLFRHLGARPLATA